MLIDRLEQSLTHIIITYTMNTTVSTIDYQNKIKRSLREIEYTIIEIEYAIIED